MPGGKTGTKAATSSARRGALAMCDVAAWVTYHIAGADVNIGVVRHDGQKSPAPQTFDDRLRHERTVPLRFVCGHRRSDRQLQHGGVLTFAQLCQ